MTTTPAADRPTPADVLREPAGIRLDGWAAVYVEGWTELEQVTEPKTGEAVLIGFPPKKGRMKFGIPQPSWSDHAALALFDAVPRGLARYPRGLDLTLAGPQSYGWHASLWCAEYGDALDPAGAADGDTRALALTRALVVAALEGKLAPAAEATT